MSSPLRRALIPTPLGRVSRVPFITGSKTPSRVVDMSTITNQHIKGQSQKHQVPKRPKKPQLTHFLCLPLINTHSLPQLEASIAAFTADHQLERLSQQRCSPTIPQGAVRPVGTIHLTLGVMSLPNKERLQDAVAFLKSLDLSDLLREADRVARERGEKSAKKARTTQSQAHPQPQQPASEALPPVSYNSQATPQLLRVSLESLHALPRAKAATVLHASPVDPTGRLYPFCVMLRDKFIEAGFVLNESKNEMPNKPSDSAVAASPSPSSQCKYMPGDDKPTLKEQPGSPAEKSKSELTAWHTHADPYTAALARKPKPRPLLLHATLVNTIYVRGRSKPKNRNGKNGQNGSKRLEFDARDILQRYRNYFVDQARTIAADDSRTEVTTSVLEISSSAETRLTSSQGVECVSDTGPLTPISQPLYPFVWARDIPIDSVCICEMGAKKLEIGGGDDDGLNARLGENYTVVAEQKIELDL